MTLPLSECQAVTSHLPVLPTACLLLPGEGPKKRKSSNWANSSEHRLFAAWIKGREGVGAGESLRQQFKHSSRGISRNQLHRQGCAEMDSSEIGVDSSLGTGRWVKRLQGHCSGQMGKNIKCYPHRLGRAPSKAPSPTPAGVSPPWGCACSWAIRSLPHRPRTDSRRTSSFQT